MKTIKVFKGIFGGIFIALAIGILFELVPLPSALGVGLAYLALGIEFVINGIISIID